MRLAREFRRADWRRMLSEMSATELGEWGDYFRMQSFSDVWMDAQFASLKRRTKNAKTFHDKCENFTFRASNETAALTAVFLFIKWDHFGYG